MPEKRSLLSGGWKNLLLFQTHLYIPYEGVSEIFGIGKNLINDHMRI